MRFEPTDPPRTFRVGTERQIEMSDCGQIHLEADEQVTFVTPAGRQHDFAAKSWGFYATPSVNGRLVAQGFKTALVRNSGGRWYVMVVDTDHMEDFEAYLKREGNAVEEWLDER